MENIRMSKPVGVRIERNRGDFGVRVLIDGVNLAHHVLAVTWSARVGERPTATVTFANVEVDVEVEDAPGEENLTFRTEQPGWRLLTPEEVSQLRKFAPAAAAFLESVKPVVAREHVIPMDVVRTPVPKVPAPGEKRTPEEWCAAYGVEIQDPDGWRRQGDPAWDEPITLPDFWSCAVRSTLRAAGGAGWQGVQRDAKLA